MGIKDSVSGADLARGGDRILWLLPVFMLVIILLGLWRSLEEKLPAVFALASTVGGSITAYLMYHERSSMNESPRCVTRQGTGLVLVGFFAFLSILAAPLVFFCCRCK